MTTTSAEVVRMKLLDDTAGLGGLVHWYLDVMFEGVRLRLVPLEQRDGRWDGRRRRLLLEPDAPCPPSVRRAAGRPSECTLTSAKAPGQGPTKATKALTVVPEPRTHQEPTPVTRRRTDTELEEAGSLLEWLLADGRESPSLAARRWARVERGMPGKNGDRVLRTLADVGCLRSVSRGSARTWTIAPDAIAQLEGARSDLTAGPGRSVASPMSDRGARAGTPRAAGSRVR